MTIKEVIEGLEKAFPGCRIGGVRRVVVTDADSIRHFKLAWEILIAEPKKEDKSE